MAIRCCGLDKSLPLPGLSSFPFFFFFLYLSRDTNSSQLFYFIFLNFILFLNFTILY